MFDVSCGGRRIAWVQVRKNSRGGAVACADGIVAIGVDGCSPFALGDLHLFAQVVDQFGRIDHVDIGGHAQNKTTDASHRTKIGFETPFAVVFGCEVFRGTGIFVDQHTATQITQAQTDSCASGTGEMEQIDEVCLVVLPMIPVQIK